MNLNQITIPVINMEEASLFYLKMGFIQIVESPHYARFRCPQGQATFSLLLTHPSGINPTVVYFETDRLKELVGELQERGIAFDQLPTPQRYLWTEAILRDPSGNRIKLYWAGENRLHPPWEIEKRWRSV